MTVRTAAIRSSTSLPTTTPPKRILRDAYRLVHRVVDALRSSMVLAANLFKGAVRLLDLVGQRGLGVGGGAQQLKQPSQERLPRISSSIRLRSRIPSAILFSASVMSFSAPA